MGCTSDKMVAPSLTENDRHLIKTSWSSCSAKGDFSDVGLVMFLKLFQDYSELKPLYSFMRDENGNDKTKLRDHGKGVMEVVDVAVSGIDNLMELHPVLVDLGSRHHRYGVKKAHLQPVGKCLIYTLEKHLEKEFTKDARNSWMKFFSVLSVGFSEGLDNAERLSKGEGQLRSE